MKQRIIVVYSKMIIGGATTALLSFLQCMDLKKYDVDLLLYDNSGVWQDKIPSGISILPQAKVHEGKSLKSIAFRLSPRYIKAFFKARKYAKLQKNDLVKNQIMWSEGIWLSRQVDQNYDCAISYLEFWPLKYTANRINANRKIAWIHVDYAISGMLAQLDAQDFDKVDKIVHVSKVCNDNFVKYCPQYISKSTYIENIMSQELIRKAGNALEVEVPFVGKNNIVLCSVCRIVYRHKGLDRVVEAFGKLQKEGALSNIYWVVIGEGEDSEIMKARIKELNLSDRIVMLGAKPEPLPYLAKCDCMILPSRFEGKPMSVTEAHMLGLPVIATEYASASEQIESGIDGIILENSDQGVYRGLKDFIKNKANLDKLKANTLAKDYSNIMEMKKVEQLIGQTEVN